MHILDEVLLKDGAVELTDELIDIDDVECKVKD